VQLAAPRRGGGRSPPKATALARNTFSWFDDQMTTETIWSVLAV
jgi:hypothetical protein